MWYECAGFQTMNFSHERSIRESLQEYGRGIAGGLIFALPLLYTMELWNAAFTISPEKLLLYFGFTFSILLLYNRHAGLRSDASYIEVLIDSIEELGLGLLLSFLVQYLLGRIGGDHTLYEITSRVVIQGATLAIGISVGTAQLGTKESKDDSGLEGDNSEDSGSYNYLGQSGIALCGAILFTANIAPTDEVGILAREASPGRLASIVAVSLLLGSTILYFSEFRGTDRHLPHRGWTWMSREIVTSYAAALAASALIITFFESFPAATRDQFVASVIVVSLPAMLGASAGRFLLQIQSESTNHE